MQRTKVAGWKVSCIWLTKKPHQLLPWLTSLPSPAHCCGPKFAYYIGAYGLILTGWFGGLLYGLYRRSVDAKMPIWAYAMCTLIGSLGATVPAAEFASQYIPIPLTTLLFPVAFTIPAVPDKWSAVALWALERWQSMRGAPR